MSITRAEAEVILIRRAGRFMRAAYMDYETQDGSNPDLNDPIGYAARACDLTVTNLTGVQDTDLDGLNINDIDKLLDIAEYRLLLSVLGNYDKFGLKVGPRSEYQSQLAERLEPRVKWLAERMETQYGVGAATLEAGYISRDFADHNETVAEET